MGTAEESADRMYWLLQDALSDVAHKRTAAESALRDAEEQPDFFASLVMILAAGDDNAAPQIRWLAAVVGKNAVNRSWRRRGKKNAVTDDERDFVRNTLLSCIGEPHSTIAAQICVWVARIARIDYPSSWPDLLFQLNAILNANDVGAPNTLLHALRTADEVFDVLASRRLLADRKAMYAASPAAFSSIYALFQSHLQRMVNNDAVNADSARSSFQIVVVCMKCMRSLVNHGFQRIKDVRDVHDLYANILNNPDLFLRGANGGTEAQLELSLLAARLVLCGFDRFPDDFQIFLPRFLEVYYTMVTTYNVETAADMICATAAQFLRSVLQCPEYNSSAEAIQEYKERGAAAPQDEKESGRLIMLSFFNEQRVDVLIHTMLSKVFVLRPVEVSSWMDDPESFVREDDSAEWGTYSLRAECESIFKTLLIRDKRRIAPKIIRHAETVPANEPLLRDACYRAVGNAVRDLQGLFDFEAWFQAQLGPILQSVCGNGIGERIVQARAAWLVGQFVEQLSRDSRIVLYGLLVNLMSREGGDRVVALTSVGALVMLVYDQGFNGHDFAPHLQLCMNTCFKLILESDTLAMKRDQIELATQLVKNCYREDVLNVVPALAEALPLVWQSDRQAHGLHENTINATENGDKNGDQGSGDANMLKTALTLFLYEFLKKIGHGVTLSAPLHRFVHEVIVFGTDVRAGGGGVFLIEEACDLWQVLLACSTEYTEELSALFVRVPEILNDDAMRLKDMCHVIEGYVLLGRDKFLNVHGSALRALLQNAVNAGMEYGVRGRIAAAEIIDLLLLQFPVEGVAYLAPLLQHIFVFVTTDQRQSQSKVLAAAYLALFARASLTNIEAVETHLFQGNLSRVTELFDRLGKWLDLVYRRARKRSVVLALAGLATRYMQSTEIRQRIPRVLSAAVQVLASEFDTRPGKNGDKQSRGTFENIVARHGETGERADEAVPADLPESARRKALYATDPANNVRVGQAVVALLEAVRNQDEAVYMQIVEQTGRQQMSQLEKLVEMENAKANANGH